MCCNTSSNACMYKQWGSGKDRPLPLLSNRLRTEQKITVSKVSVKERVKCHSVSKGEMWGYSQRALGNIWKRYENESVQTSLQHSSPTLSCKHWIVPWRPYLHWLCWNYQCKYASGVHQIHIGASDRRTTLHNSLIQCFIYLKGYWNILHHIPLNEKWPCCQRFGQRWILFFSTQVCKKNSSWTSNALKWRNGHYWRSDDK